MMIKMMINERRETKLFEKGHTMYLEKTDMNLAHSTIINKIQATIPLSIDRS